jgi:hypothetical protein
MKHLKNYKIFESSSEDILQEVNDILQELVDENWIIKTEHSPKKWGNYIIIPEKISVLIKKKQNNHDDESGHVRAYPEGSLFKFSEVADYLHRVIDYLVIAKGTLNEYEVSFCELNKVWYSSLPGTGTWSNWDSELPDLDQEILGIEIKIYISR